METLTIFNGDDFVETNIIQLTDAETDEVIDLYLVNEIARHSLRSELKQGVLDPTKAESLGKKLRVSSLEMFKVLYERLGEDEVVKLIAEIDLNIKLAEEDENNS
jgi:hypothetical protein